MMKRLKTIFNKAANTFFLVGFFVLIIASISELGTRYPRYLPICLESRFSDSDSFGSAFAVDKNYLAVGDPEANRVAIYQRQPDGNWLRKKDILPPFNIKKTDDFGSALALNGDTLAIAAKHRKSARTGNDLEELYVASIVNNRNTAIHRIYRQQEKIRQTDFTFSLFDDNIAIAATVQVDLNTWVNRISILDPRNSKIVDTIELPNYLTPKSKQDLDFEFDKQLPAYLKLNTYKNYLLVTKPYGEWQDAIYLLSPDLKLQKVFFDLKEFNQEERKRLSGCRIQDVFVSDELMAVNCNVRHYTPYISGVHIYNISLLFENFPQPSRLKSFDLDETFNVYQSHVIGASYNNRGITLIKVEKGNISERYFIRKNQDKERTLYPNSIGIITEEDVFLNSGYGTIMRLPIDNLHHHVNIKSSSCTK